jgi:DNA-binding CsgD family transcriptional regulator
VGIHYLGALGKGQPLKRFFDFMGIASKIPVKKMGLNKIIDKYIFDDFTFDLPEGIDAYEHNLRTAFPDEQKQIDGIIKHLKPIGQKMISLDFIFGDQTAFTDPELFIPIEDIMNKLPKRKRQQKVAVRLHNQAYQQNGVLTYADTAAIMRLSPGTVGKYIREYEKEHNIPVPRRGNIHDMGPTLTHKKIICVKHLMEGKTIEITARETNHSTSAVTRYINDFKRVYICLNSGWEYDKIAQATGMSQSLVKEYVDLIESNDNVNSSNFNENLLDAKK